MIVFYANPYGQLYRNFPSGPDAMMPNVGFVDLGLTLATTVNSTTTWRRQATARWLNG